MDEILNGYGSYLKDESKLSYGSVDMLAIPENETETAGFLKNCFEKNIQVTVSNGRTGVTGGAIPMKGALLSVEKLNKILGVEKLSGEYVINVQSGVSLAEIDRYLGGMSFEGKKYFYPVDVTEATAHIGGNISTNASGERSFRYGPTRKWVRRLKMALSDGTVVEIIRGKQFAKGYELELALPSGAAKKIPVPKYRMPAVKNAAGYFSAPGMDMIDLFIGSEGTLGVVLEVGLAIAPKPETIVAILAFFPSEKEAIGFFMSAKKELKSAIVFEYFDSGAMNMLRGKFPELPAGKESAIFFELCPESGGTDELIRAVDVLLEKYGCHPGDTWAGFEKKDAEKIRLVRHGIPETINEILAQRKIKYPSIYKIAADIAVPEGRLLEMIDYYKSSVVPRGLEYTMFGHIGENHLHMNILPRDMDEFAQAKKLHTAFAEKAVSLGGTVSAEHGIGKIKHEYLRIMYGGAGLTQMAEVKKSLDPKCLLNRGNIIPEEFLNR